MRFRRRWTRLLAGVVAAMVAASSAVLAVLLTAAPGAAAPPPDFRTSLVVGDGLDGPSGLAIAPDGRIVILENSGLVKIVKNGQLLYRPLSICRPRRPATAV